MERKLITTADGSKTIHLPDLNEQYHSKHGALQESLHVFIQMGLLHFARNKTDIKILEIGFGTGLNALLTFFEAKKTNLKIEYTGIEAFPVTESEWKVLNYGSLVNDNDGNSIFESIQSARWETNCEISKNFLLKKEKKKFQEIEYQAVFDLIYFDAFGARVQPDLWTEDIFEIMYNALKDNGVLVTYSAKGSVRRAMQAVGFIVEHLPGPPGKREMLRATKHSTDKL